MKKISTSEALMLSGGLYLESPETALKYSHLDWNTGRHVYTVSGSIEQKDGSMKQVSHEFFGCPNATEIFTAAAVKMGVLLCAYTAAYFGGQFMRTVLTPASESEGPIAL